MAYFASVSSVAEHNIFSFFSYLKAFTAFDLNTQ